MTLMRDLMRSHLRVAAIAETNQRYGAIIDGMTTAVEREWMATDDPEQRQRLGSVLADAAAQLTATSDALDRAIASLPEAAE